MFIGVGIDDEHYTQLDYCFKTSLTDILNVMKQIANEALTDCYIELTFSNKNAGRALRGDAISMISEHKFYVFEIFEISNFSKHILVSWHAYDGVDFSVKEFDDIDEARKMLKDTYENGYLQYKEDTSDDCNELELDSSVLDTGYEWLMQEIVDNKQYKEDDNGKV